MREGLFTDRLREAWRELVALNGRRAETETSIREELTTATASATGERDRAVTAAEVGHANRTRAIDAGYGQHVKQVEDTASTEERKTQRTYDVELGTINEKADHSGTEAQKRLDEAIWATETVFEATQDQPRERYEQSRRVLDGKLDELRTLERETHELIQRYRQRPPSAAPEPDPGSAYGDVDTADDLDELITEGHERFERLRRIRAARLFVGLRLPTIVFLLMAVAATIAWWQSAWKWSPWIAIAPGIVLALAVVAAFVLHAMARTWIRRETEPLQQIIERGITGHAAGLRQAESTRDIDYAGLVEQRDREFKAARNKYEPILEEISRRKQAHLDRIHSMYPQMLEDIRTNRESELTSLTSDRDTRLAEADTRRDETISAARERYDRETVDTRARAEERTTALRDEWSVGSRRVQDVFDEVAMEDGRLFLAWDDPGWVDWSPPVHPAGAIRFGRLQVSMNDVDGGMPDPEAPAGLTAPWPEQFTLPAALAFPSPCSLLLEAGEHGLDDAVQTIQTVMFRLLTSLPPGKVRFTLVDPVGLGQNFAGFMHLADHLETLVTDRIWTEARHIEQRLADLTDHMETVIQKYLRNEYETIALYNEQAGEIAEPYRFLVVADYPSNFSETAARRLASIVNSGARCGVYTLLSRDTRQAAPKGLELADLRAQSVHLLHENGRFVLQDEDFGALPLVLDQPPDPEFNTHKLKLVAEAARDASRVEVPFAAVAPDVNATWTRRANEDFRVPLGRTGATKLQELELGHGTSQHVLIAGKTGSGKSTLLHVLVTNLALWYAPDEVQLYLVDFKKGVEFKCYATHQLPHARAVAIESDREFGLSVLRRLDTELKRRGDRFRDQGVQDVAGFRAACPDEPMPRTLLIVDEFQELFVEDDKIGQDAAMLLDRLVRQGRAFGIHVILGSQTLGGAYSLAKSTMGQMAVRIALQCSESDSYLIFNEDNSAARLLGRPGEAIYNDASGMIEGNSPFQIVWLPDSVRDQRLAEVRELAESRGYRPAEPQIVFEGNAPADLLRNRALEDLLGAPGWTPTVAPRMWLGEAVAIKDPTNAVFRRQSGSNLLIVGQRDESALAMFATGLASLGAQHPPADPGGTGDGASFMLLDGTPIDAAHAGRLGDLGATLPHDVEVIAWRDVPDAMQNLAAEIDRRMAEDATDIPRRYLMIFGLQRFRDLRQSDDFSFSMSDDDKPPAADKLFRRVLQDGPGVGVHTIVWCDTATNVDRTLDRQMMREFDMRVVFQMSATDSTNLIDSPQATKLGLHHALFHSEEQGIAEKFRPYAMPEDGWLEKQAEGLRTRSETSCER